MGLKRSTTEHSASQRPVAARKVFVKQEPGAEEMPLASTSSSHQPQQKHQEVLSEGQGLIGPHFPDEFQEHADFSDFGDFQEDGAFSGDEGDDTNTGFLKLHLQAVHDERMIKPTQEQNLRFGLQRLLTSTSPDGTTKHGTVLREAPVFATISADVSDRKNSGIAYDLQEFILKHKLEFFSTRHPVIPLPGLCYAIKFEGDGDYATCSDFCKAKGDHLVGFVKGSNRRLSWSSRRHHRMNNRLVVYTESIRDTDCEAGVKCHRTRVMLADDKRGIYQLCSYQGCYSLDMFSTAQLHAVDKRSPTKLPCFQERSQLHHKAPAVETALQWEPHEVGILGDMGLHLEQLTLTQQRNLRKNTRRKPEVAGTQEWGEGERGRGVDGRWEAERGGTLLQREGSKQRGSRNLNSHTNE